ncbi:hypothetical protein DJ018_15330 [Phenylobacterium deserti]|uniref:Uncharacterized protein n=1 Tax=Phenylobacterium deserti TaxID=1914756 RepID=A0A328AD39_9CAUL|nr:hypothetical protein DJ018_15330 [Phenylobacterium deserti]
MRDIAARLPLWASVIIRRQSSQYTVGAASGSSALIRPIPSPIMANLMMRWAGRSMRAPVLGRATAQLETHAGGQGS